MLNRELGRRARESAVGRLERRLDARHDERDLRLESTREYGDEFTQEGESGLARRERFRCELSNDRFHDARRLRVQLGDRSVEFALP